MPTQNQPEMAAESSPEVEQSVSAPGKTSSEVGVTNSEEDLKPSGPIPAEFTWGDGELWEILSTTPGGHPANEESHEPLYVISPVPDAEHSPQGDAHPALPLEHDHVVPVPSGNHGTYNAVWHVKLVVEPGGTLNDFTLAGGDKGLTSAAAVQAAADAGEVDILPVPESQFVCPVRPATE
jgi:hypothetical protein